MIKKAFVTGITGQDGSYLADLLLDKNYEVYGMHRRSSVDGHLGRVAHLAGKLNLVCGDLMDVNSLDRIISEIKPDLIFNTAAQSQVKISFEQPLLTREVNYFGVERLLYLVQLYVPHARFLQCSTSELFGAVLESPQTELTPFNPISPYAKSKLEAHRAVERYRKDGLFACSSIGFNHESCRRSLEFVTRKITDGLVRYHLGIPQRETGELHLELGNLNAKRDWMHAMDVCNGMMLMLEQDSPSDYILASGQNHTVKEFIRQAGECLDMKISWQGWGDQEVGYGTDGEIIIKVNPEFYRPAEVHTLLGDSTRAKKDLGWKPAYTFEGLVEEMIESDLRRLSHLSRK